MKTCIKCGVEQSTSEFHKCKRDGLQSWCKSCKKLWAGRNRVKRRAHQKTYYENNKGKVLSNVRSYQARKKGLTPDMNKAELVEIESMYLYNQIMPGAWEVDHIKPLAEGGLHHPSNLQILTEHDNRSKGDRWVS